MIRREIRIVAPPSSVFAFLIEPAKIARWCGTDAVGGARAGGAYRRVINPGHIVSGTYIEVVPDRRVVHTWGWINSETIPPGSTIVEIDLVPDDGGTIIKLTHRDPVAAAGKGHAELWDHYLPRLALAAAGRDPGPDPWGGEP